MTQILSNMINKKDVQTILLTIEESLKVAGEILLADFHQPNGPRGSGGKAPADTEAEFAMRAIIKKHFPQHRVIGEELPSENDDQKQSPFVWLLDPNDGTVSYIKGYRGSASSIGLLYQGQPIAGGVYAYAYPNHSGDLIMGGMPEIFGGVTRNGVLCPIPKSRDPKKAIIAISQGADDSSLANSAQLKPSRYLAIPSIAYRLALAAVDEVQVGVSVNGPVAYDLAGGHALLKAQGRDLYYAPHQPYTYNAYAQGPYSNQFAGGDSELCALVLANDLNQPRAQPDQKDHPYPLCQPRKVKSQMSTDERLNRAQGALLGMMSGDALGSLVEFQSSASILRQYPNGVTEMKDGGTFHKLAGQVTDDSEMAISLARSIIQHKGYDQASAAVGYVRWLNSHPFDVGITTRTSLSPALKALRKQASPQQVLDEALKHASLESQANGALMRITPIALYAAGQNLSDDDAAELARLDALITHPHLACQDANAVFVVALKRAILGGGTPQEIYQHALQWAEQTQLTQSVLERLRQAAHTAPTEGKGWVLIGLQAAFYALLHHQNPSDAIHWAISLGHDTDTNAAIVGALLGAVHGLTTLPSSWIRAVITSRPSPELGRGSCHRPKWLWSCDALLMSEELISDL